MPDADRLRLVAAQVERVEALQRELQHATDVLRALSANFMAPENEGTPDAEVQAWLNEGLPTPDENG